MVAECAPWFRFKERYDPFSAEMALNKIKEEAQARAKSFVELAESGALKDLALDDGQDLRVEGEKVSIDGMRSYPASMGLPDRLRAAAAKKPNMITLSNISPQISQEELERMLRECTADFVAVETSLPVPEKGNYRMGWAIFQEKTDLAPIVTAIEEKIMHGDKIYCSAQKSFALQIKIVGHALTGEERIRKDLALAKDLRQALEGLFGIEQSPSEQLLSSMSEKGQLDLLILYLRRVFFLCFYSGVVGASYQDLCRLAGDLCVRSDDATVGGDVDGELFEEALSDLKNRLTGSHEPFSEDALLEKHVARVDEGRYRCVHCSKLFKGPDFVVKHLRLKHEDVAKAAALETASLNAFLARPVLNAVLPLTGRRRRSSPSLERAPPSSRDGHYYQDRRHARDSYRGGAGSRRTLPPPPRDAPQDPRRLRHYVDWDAPASGDMEISYE